MDEFDILKELEKLDDDIEPGFLKDLQQRAPEELHSRIMNSIRQETVIKKRFNFNYKRYASFATAAALLVITILAGINHALVGTNLDNTRDQAPGSYTSGRISDIREPLNTAGVKDPQKPSDKKPSTSNPGKTVPAKAKPDKNIVASSGTVTGDKSASDKNSGTVTTTSTKTQPGNTATKKPTVNKPAANKSTEDDNNITIVAGTKKPSGSGTTGKTGQVATNNTPSGTDPKDNTPSNPAGNQSGNEGSTTASGDNSNPSGQNNNIPLNTPDSSQAVAGLDNINYEISLNLSQTYIIQFIKEKGSPQSSEAYKLSLSDFDVLNEMLKQNSIQLKPVNPINEVTDDFVIIKMNIY